MASPETEELPELETAALEELGAEALAPIEPPASQADPFGDLGALPPAVEAAPPPPAAAPPVEVAKPSTVSAKELTDDILGGVDFDVPAQTAQQAAAAPKITPVTPKPMAPPAADGKPGAFAFKPATPAFASGGMPKPASPFGSPAGSPLPSPSPFGSKPSPIAAVAKPAAPVAAQPPPAGQVDPKSLFGDIGAELGSLGEESPPTPAAPAKAPGEALKEALLAADMPAQLPPDALRLAFKLCRVLVQKGVISVDDLV